MQFLNPSDMVNESLFILYCRRKKFISCKKKKIGEFLLWCNGIGSVSAAAGHRFWSPVQYSVLRIWRCCRSISHSCGLDLTPGLGTPYASEQPKRKKKKKENTILRFCYLTPYVHLLRKPSCKKSITEMSVHQWEKSRSLFAVINTGARLSKLFC